MIGRRPYILTIAGFDPSSGAGLTADIKTMEALKCYGLGVCTSNTVQNDIVFEACHWSSIDQIKAQIGLLFDRFKIDIVKIGIVENWLVLNKVIDILIERNCSIRIILDPIIRSSTSYDFNKMEQQNMILFEEILKKIYLITPNYDEVKSLYKKLEVDDTINKIQTMTNILLKGGHRSDIGVDDLYQKNGKHYKFKPNDVNVSDKHGSGCVLSSAICCFLAFGNSLNKSCEKGKNYTERFLASNNSLLGFHSSLND